MKEIFRIKVDALNMKKSNRYRGASKIIREWSTESGVPFRVLSGFYSDKGHGIHRPVCVKCNDMSVEISAQTGRPFTEISKNYGLCVGCRKERINERNKTA